MKKKDEMFKHMQWNTKLSDSMVNKLSMVAFFFFFVLVTQQQHQQ